MEWSCKKSGKQILVYEDRFYRGCYWLLEEPYCRVCAHTNVETQLCNDHSDLGGFKRIYAMGKFTSNYNDMLSYHIYAVKKYPIFARPLGGGLEIVMKEIYPELLESTLLVPIPQHPDKLAERGFNQSLLLSTVVGEGLDLPVKNVLVKTENIDLRPLCREERRLAVEKMYDKSGNCQEKISGERILIIDDVVTTGFTAAKCARLLKEAGAESINVLVAGRTG